jgi:hypothetical protein
MSATLRKFIPRAPRYTLRPNDNRLMRFAHQEEKGIAHTTQFLDISMTGLAFVIDREEAPFIFEHIKIEVPLDGEETIAWWAKVIRVEEYAPHKWYMPKDAFGDDQTKCLVAVTFENLPEGHVARIKRTLEVKFLEVSKENRAEHLRNLAALWAHHSWQLVFYFGLIVATFAVLWFLAQPDENYGAKGAPWGERFTEGILKSGKWDE